MSALTTLFLDAEGNRLASAEGVLPIPLVKDMAITIHGHEGSFRVVEWNYHHGQPNEDAGLRIILQHVNGDSV